MSRSVNSRKIANWLLVQSMTLLYMILWPMSGYSQPSWQTLANAPPGGSRYEDIYFVNESIGWAVSKVLMAKTTDGGDSWEVFHPGEAFFAASPLLILSMDGWEIFRACSYKPMMGD